MSELRARIVRLRDELTPDEELVFATEDVPVDLLALCYPLGIFPWPFEEDQPIPWVCPAERAILRFGSFRLGRSSRRKLRLHQYHVTTNQAFDQVIEACATTPGRDTWIFPAMVAAYKEAHRTGLAESVEVWKDGKLVGGLYGIRSPGFFSGESMFHRGDSAGKAAVAGLLAHLSHRGDTWFDIQQLTPHMESMGAEAVSRTAFLQLISDGG